MNFAVSFLPLHRAHTAAKNTSGHPFANAAVPSPFSWTISHSLTSRIQN